MTLKTLREVPSQTDYILVPLKKEDLEVQLEALLKAYDLSISIKDDFKAEAEELAYAYQEQRKIVLVGLGSPKNDQAIVQCFRSASFDLRKKTKEHIYLDLRWLVNVSTIHVAELAINGVELGYYQIGRFKSEQSSDVTALKEIGLIVHEEEESVQQAAQRGRQLASTQMAMMDLVNAPSNKKLPADIANYARKSAKEYGYSIKVLEGEECRVEGLHALMAVNRGSEHPAAFIVAHYQPREKASHKVALVGKGVTFDTGGLSIKPSMKMHLMKSDMGGAAAVLGTIESVARLGLAIEVVAIVPATDNSVDAKSTKPSDVFDSYSGKTIEMIDTDAEGRLILADGLAYAVKNYQPDVMINLATLTGSSVRALGYAAGALFSSNDELAEQLFQAGLKTGEKLWRLPLWDDYKDDISSDVADVRNFSGKPIAGAISAAKFLEFFTSEHPNWAHLDIAGVAFTDSKYAQDRSSTAFGIRLLLEYLRNLIAKS